MSVHGTMDKLGATISGACAAHCALAPLLITLAPLLGISFILDKRFETAMILVAVGLASLSIGWGFVKKHRRFLPLGVFLLGLALIAIAQFGFFALPEPAFMALGGLSIAASHLVNARLCKHCDDCSHEH